MLECWLGTAVGPGACCWLKCMSCIWLDPMALHCSCFWFLDDIGLQIIHNLENFISVSSYLQNFWMIYPFWSSWRALHNVVHDLSICLRLFCSIQYLNIFSCSISTELYMHYILSFDAQFEYILQNKSRAPKLVELVT